MKTDEQLLVDYRVERLLFEIERSGDLLDRIADAIAGPSIDPPEWRLRLARPVWEIHRRRVQRAWDRKHT